MSERHQTQAPAPRRWMKLPWPGFIFGLLILGLGSAALVAAAQKTPDAGSALQDGPAALRQDPQDPLVLPELARDAGRILFKTNRDGEMAIYIMDADGSNQRPLDRQELYEAAGRQEAISPGKDWFAFTQQSGPNYTLFVQAIGSGWQDALAQGLGSASAPAWSPDGSLLAYAAQQGASSSILLAASTGGAPAGLGPAYDYADRHPSWSPDGSQLAFSSNRTGRLQIWAINADGSGARNVSQSNADDWDPVWVKAPAETGAPDASLETELSLGTWDSGCAIGISVVAGRVAGQPITRIQIADQASPDSPILDTGAISVTTYSQVLPLKAKPGVHRLEARAWNAGSYAGDPLVRTRDVTCAAPATLPPVRLSAETRSPSPTCTPSPTFIIVTPAATPADVFAAATAAAVSTEQTLKFGTPTPTPPNLVTATFTPRPIVVTSTPVPENAATATYLRLRATAIAFTTGTPAPPAGPVVTATPVPPTAQPTETPVFVDVAFWDPEAALADFATPTAPPFPEVLRGRILFLSDLSGEEQAYAVNPDGGGLVMLTDRWPYDAAAEMEGYSGTRQYRAYVKEDGSGLLQIFYDDAMFHVTRQLTGFGTGTAWDPVWSPVDDLVAFVSNESETDEIWIIRKDQPPATQLTHTHWVWNHHPSWSPDGKSIVFMSNRTGVQQIWIMDADGGNQRPLTGGSFAAWDPTWVKTR